MLCTSALSRELAFADLQQNPTTGEHSGRSQQLVEKIRKLRENRIEDGRHHT